MKNKKKKWLTILLVFTLALGIMPLFAMPSRAADSVVYEPVTIEYAIFNSENSNNQKFYNEYAKKNAYYNAAANFTGFDPSARYKFHAGTYVWENFLYWYSGQIGDMKLIGGYTIYGQLAKLGQLEVNLSGTLHNDKHTHTKNLFWEADSFVYQYARLVAYNYTNTPDW